MGKALLRRPGEGRGGGEPCQEKLGESAYAVSVGGDGPARIPPSAEQGSAFSWTASNDVSPPPSFVLSTSFQEQLGGAGEPR